MAYICLRAQLSGTVDTGGVWKWQGPGPITIDIQGQGVTALSVGDTIPGGDNPCVDPDTVTGLSAGTYVNAFEYCGPACGAANCSYIDLVLAEAPCAGANATTTHCVTSSSQINMNDRLGTAACGKGNTGNWVFVSGSNNAHLSNDGNAANDYFVPSEFPVGTHVYRKDDINGCGTESATLTIVIEDEFNAGGDDRTITLCDYVTNKQGNLLDLLNQRLADLGQPPASPGGEWVVFGYAQSYCPFSFYQSGVMELNVNSGGCVQYNTDTVLAGGDDNPHVDFSCEQTIYNQVGGHFGLTYRAPSGASCPGVDYTHCFLVEDCPGPNCEASVTISESGCVVSSSISGTCANPSYQWQRQNGAVWDNIAGETGATYTSATNETVRVQVSCADGCSYNSPPLSVSCLPGCEASVDISATGCNLSSSITGTCASPTYQWQKWSGTAWVNIPGATSSTYAATENGEYSLEVTCADGCVYYSGSVLINKTVTISEQNCLITAVVSGFNSPTYQWQKNTGGGWADLAGETASTHTADDDADYRVIVTDTGGCEFTSNVLTVTCSGGGGNTCGPLTVNIQLINGGTQIEATISGCTNIGQVDWFYSLSGGSCAAASGWAPVSNPPSCNGQGTCVLTPVDGAACYRVFYNCDDDQGCLETAEIYWEPSCAASVEIDRTDCLYDIRSYKAGDTGDASGTRATWSDHMSVIYEVGVQAYENCPSPNTPYQSESVVKVLEQWSCYETTFTGAFALVENEYIQSFKIHKDTNGTITEHLLDLSAVVYTGQSASAFASALEAEIISEMTALGLTQNTHYKLLQVSAFLSGSNMGFTITLASRDRQAGETWAGVDKNDSALDINGGVSPRFYIDVGTQKGFSSITPQTVTRTTPCGLELEVLVEEDNTVDQITHSTANYNTIPDYTTNDGAHTKTYNGNNRTCIELDAVITGTCNSPVYAWNGGNATSQKIVTPGSGYHQVDVTCDDGCEYSDNITV